MSRARGKMLGASSVHHDHKHEQNNWRSGFAGYEIKKVHDVMRYANS